MQNKTIRARRPKLPPAALDSVAAILIDAARRLKDEAAVEVIRVGEQEGRQGLRQLMRAKGER